MLLASFGVALHVSPDKTVFFIELLDLVGGFHLWVWVGRSEKGANMAPRKGLFASWIIFLSPLPKGRKPTSFASRRRQDDVQDARRSVLTTYPCPTP